MPSCALLRDWRVHISRQRRFCHFDQSGEGFCIRNSNFSQHTTVQFNLGKFQTLNEPVVSHTVGTCGSVNTRDPQTTEIAFTFVTVLIIVDIRVQYLLVSLTVQTGTLTAVPFSARPYSTALFLCVNRTFDTCHAFYSFCLFPLQGGKLLVYYLRNG